MKKRIKLFGIDLRVILTALFTAIGAAALGVGICFTLIWDNLPISIVAGLAGIIVLFSMEPISKRIK